jgi:hypothetical protein
VNGDVRAAVQNVDDRRSVEAGDDLLHLVERRARHVRHQVALPASAQHGGERVDELEEGAPLVPDHPARGAVAGRRDQAGRALQDRRHLAHPVHPQRRPGRGEVDDDVGDAEVGGDLGRARYRYDLHRAPCPVEEAAGRAREGGGDARPIGDVLQRRDPALVAGGDDEAAPSILEVEQHVDRALRLAHQVPPRHAGVGRTVGHELGDVLRADEDRLELAAERGGERAVAAHAHLEPRVLEQLARLFGEATLVGESDAKHQNVHCSGAGGR